MYYVILITPDGMHHDLPDRFGSEQLARKVASDYVRQGICDYSRVVKRGPGKDVPVVAFRRRGL